MEKQDPVAKLVSSRDKWNEAQRKKFQEVLDHIRYRPEWRKRLTVKGKQFFFQWEWDDVCNFTKKPMVSRSAKYPLSPWMTKTEIVNRVFLAAVKAEEHETRERFQYRPNIDELYRAPYNTHIDIDELWRISNTFDIREKSDNGQD